MASAYYSAISFDGSIGRSVCEIIAEPGQAPTLQVFAFPLLEEGGATVLNGAAAPGALARIPIGGRFNRSEADEPRQPAWHYTRDFGRFELIPSMQPDIYSGPTTANFIPFFSEEGSLKKTFGSYITVNDGASWFIPSVALDGSAARTDLSIFVANDKFLVFDTAAAYVSDDGITWTSIATRAFVKGVGFAHGVYWLLSGTGAFNQRLLLQVSNLASSASDVSVSVTNWFDSQRYLLKTGGQLYFVCVTQDDYDNNRTVLRRIANTGPSPFVTAVTWPGRLSFYAAAAGGYVFYALTDPFGELGFMWYSVGEETSGVVTQEVFGSASAADILGDYQLRGFPTDQITICAFPDRLRTPGAGGSAPIPPPFWQGHTVTYEIP